MWWKFDEGNVFVRSKQKLRYLRLEGGRQDGGKEGGKSDKGLEA